MPSFHDDDGDASCMGILQSPAASLRVLIPIIVLNLAEIPVVCVNDPAEGLGIAMVGKTDLPDGSGLLFLFDPLPDAHVQQPLPGIGIVEHMHQIVIHIVRPQPPQFLLKQLFNTRHTFDQIVGQLGSNIDIFADAVARKNLTDGCLAAAIDIGGIIVIHAAVIGIHDLLFCGLQINDARFLLKPQTAKAQGRQFVSVFIQPVLHDCTPFFVRYPYGSIKFKRTQEKAGFFFPCREGSL